MACSSGELHAIGHRDGSLIHLLPNRYRFHGFPRIDSSCYFKRKKNNPWKSVKSVPKGIFNPYLVSSKPTRAPSALLASLLTARTAAVLLTLPSF